ncbi:fiber 1 [Duck adenovirus 3]|uniref:Fiber 1 n=1 Tax=Duck adenovirus 3 TaxID=2233538 RepID=A0A5F2P0C6_9ADEN|nr:fiber 1 [Duck adenovirus 3]
MLCPFRFIQYDSAMMQTALFGRSLKRRRRANSDTELEAEKQIKPETTTSSGGDPPIAPPPPTPPPPPPAPPTPTIDLTYPYWWPSPNYTGGGGGGGGSCTCQGDPLGPIVKTNTGFNIRLQAPVVLSGSKAVTLAVDNTLQTDGQSVGVKLSSPMISTSSGVTLDTGDGLTFDSGRLNVACTPRRSLKVTSTGLDIVTDVTINNSDTLGVNIKTNGGLKFDSAGIRVAVDGTTVKVNSNGVLQALPQVSNAVNAMEIGSPESDSGKVYAATEDNKIVVTRPYIYMVSAAGLVNGVINVKIPKNLQLDKNPYTPSGHFKFTIIVPFDKQFNVANLPPYVTIPDTVEVSSFAPNKLLDLGGFTGVPYISTDLEDETTNWYVNQDSEGFSKIKFFPATSGVTVTDASMAYGIVLCTKTGASYASDALAFSFDITMTSTWADVPTQASMTTGPLFFSYLAKIV